jgi:hypothetical protein
MTARTYRCRVCAVDLVDRGRLARHLWRDHQPVVVLFALVVLAAVVVLAGWWLR